MIMMMVCHGLLLVLQSAVVVRAWQGGGFQHRPFRARRRTTSTQRLDAAANSPQEDLTKSQNQEHQQRQEGRGDALRASTGIRPSLHPITINALVTMLRTRSGADPYPLSDDDNNKNRGIYPVDRALMAGRIAADAIASRQSTSATDGMHMTSFEEQTVAGRIVGVTMRLSNLEATLVERCSEASWIDKYGAWDTFGVLPEEVAAMTQATIGDSNQEQRAVRELLNDRIRSDPLFCLSRAECLLALFLHGVERPELAAKKATVPDGSTVDFLDEDRRDVLLTVR